MSEEIELRPLTAADVPHVISYYYDSAPAFLEAAGLDPSRLPERAQYERKLHAYVDAPPSATSDMLIVESGGQAVGHVLCNDIDRGQASFHMHFWQAAARGRHLGRRTLPRAVTHFARKHALDRIAIEVATVNEGARRLLESLGLTPVGRTEAPSGRALRAQEFYRYEIDVRHFEAPDR